MRFPPLLLAVTLGCVAPAGDGDAASGEAREAEPAADAPARAKGSPQSRAASVLGAFDLRRPTAGFDLPGRLDEVSGLAFSADGRLFAHDDERGRVHEIDPATGAVGKRWDLGTEVVRADFEGIAIHAERFFLITALGQLYEFREGADRENVAYRVTDTGIGARCEVEGLDVDPTDEVLFIACKVATPNRGAIVVHRLPLDPARPRLGPLLFAKSALPRFGIGEDFEPSGIAAAPSGTLLIVSGRHEAIIEVDRDGAVIAGAPLSRQWHRQSEGVALGADGTLYIADERNRRVARLTVYTPTSGAGDAG